MKLKIFRILAPCLFLAMSGAAHSALITVSTTLDYAQEVAPSNPAPSTATGVATIMIDTAAGLLDLSATIMGISLADVTFPSAPLAFGAAGPFHIHQGAAGTNGGIVVPFSEAGFFTGTADGLSISATDVVFDAALIAPLLAGELYLNLHSLDYASGEIRGQISVPVAVPAPSVVALFCAALLGMAFRLRRRLS